MTKQFVKQSDKQIFCDAFNDLNSSLEELRPYIGSNQEGVQKYLKFKSKLSKFKLAHVRVLRKYFHEYKFTD